jgi:hypothetical protein
MGIFADIRLDERCQFKLNRGSGLGIGISHPVTGIRDILADNPIYIG